MKWKILLLKIVTDAALLTCVMLATSCALPSAFAVPFEVGTMIWISLFAGLLLSGWLHLPRGGVACGAVFLALTMAYLVLERSEISDGARCLWYNVLSPLSSDFSFLPVPAPIGTLENPSATVTAFLGIVAIVIGMLNAFALIRGRLLLLTVMLPLPPYLVSLIYTNQPPALWTAILLVVYLGGVLVGHGMRKYNSKQMPRLTLLTLPLLVLLALLLRLVSPPQSFTPIPFEQRQAILGKTVGEVQDTVLSWIRSNPKNVRLTEENGREVREDSSFSMYVTVPGEFLLRMRSYGHYENSMWMAAYAYDGAWKSMSALGRGQDGATMQIGIRAAYGGERIVPYGFAEEPEVELSESFAHAQGRTAYGWTVLQTPDYTPHAVDAAERNYLAFAAQQYTMPDGEEKQALLEILKNAGITAGKNSYETALNVAAYVRGQGTYTLTPGETPKDKDFVQYFLTEGHKGYCVHFASATTALLQALEIPARYTVGYRVTMPITNVWTEIPESCAHAWTEVYIAGVGWIPVESTAGFGVAGVYAPGTVIGSTETVQATPTPRPVVRTTEEPAEETPTPRPTKRPLEELEERSQSGTAVQETEPEHVSAWWLLLVLIPVIPLGWLLIGSILITRRRRAFRQKDAKQAILAMVRYHDRLERCGVPPDSQLDAWAEEAMFSNHPMTAERKELYRRITDAQNTLYRNEPLKRFFARWVLLLR